jgi:hypothetical protein
METENGKELMGPPAELGPRPRNRHTAGYGPWRPGLWYVAPTGEPVAEAR